jgi:hypothetical protein
MQFKKKNFGPQLIETMDVEPDDKQGLLYLQSLLGTDFHGDWGSLLGIMWRHIKRSPSFWSTQSYARAVCSKVKCLLNVLETNSTAQCLLFISLFWSDCVTQRNLVPKAKPLGICPFYQVLIYSPWRLWLEVGVSCLNFFMGFRVFGFFFFLLL